MVLAELACRPDVEEHEVLDATATVFNVAQLQLEKKYVLRQDA
jgi:hypothetical protein